jgi:type III secretion system low calcium response chaperone LcrH/SycD
MARRKIMDLVKQMIHEVIEMSSKKLTPEEKTRNEELLNKIFFENQKPKDALGLTNDMIEYIYSLAYSLYNNANYKKAYSLFSSLSTLVPDDPRFCLALGACCHRMGNYAQAVEEYYRNSILDTRSPLPFFYMYDCYIKNKLDEHAKLCLEEVIKRSGDKAEFAPLKDKCLLMLENMKKESTKPAKVA